MNSALKEVPETLPALVRAMRISALAAQAGFEWTSMAAIRAKIAEELEELDQALQLAHGSNSASVTEEFGDLLVALVNLARHLEIDAEGALRAASSKFMRRFQYMEILANQRGTPLESLSVAQWDELWRLAKIGTATS